MIKLNGVSKYYKLLDKKRSVLKDIDFVFDRGVNIGVLGNNGAGKSTLFRLISGSEMPDKGNIIRTSSVSWPLGFTGGFHGSLSGKDNIQFAARIYGRDQKEVFNFVTDFAELGPYIYNPIKSYSSGMKARLAFGLSMAIDFDFYLIDEVIAVGDAKFKKKCKLLLNERRKTSTMLLVSHSNSLLRDFCQAGIILRNGSFLYYPNIEDAIMEHELQSILEE